MRVIHTLANARGYRTRVFGFTTLIAFVLCSAALADAAPVPLLTVFLLAGQSNFAGRASNYELKPAADAVGVDYVSSFGVPVSGSGPPELQCSNSLRPLRAALDRLKREGRAFKLRAFVWSQGEADTTRSDWAAALIATGFSCRSLIGMSGLECRRFTSNCFHDVSWLSGVATAHRMPR